MVMAEVVVKGKEKVSAKEIKAEEKRIDTVDQRVNILAPLFNSIDMDSSPKTAAMVHGPYGYHRVEESIVVRKRLEHVP